MNTNKHTNTHMLQLSTESHIIPQTKAQRAFIKCITGDLNGRCSITPRKTQIVKLRKTLNSSRSLSFVTKNAFMQLRFCIFATYDMPQYKRLCFNIFNVIVFLNFFLQCFDTVGWATGRASGL